MKNYNVIETIRLFIMKAQTNKALDELYQFCTQNNLSDIRDQIVMLSSSHNEVKNAELMGLGQYVEEKNRINLALLKIIRKLDDQLDKQEALINKADIQTDKIHLLDSKIDFLLEHIEKNDDIAFYSFNQSKLWNKLEAVSQEYLMTANIIEKEGKQDQYAEAIMMYMNAVQLELNTKLFAAFKSSLGEGEPDRDRVIDEFVGMNKNALYDYLSKDKKLSLNQMSEILLSNVLCVEKDSLKGLGLEFYKFFHKVYKVKYNKEVIQFLERYIEIKTRQIKSFTQTLIDVSFAKDNVITLFLNLQPRNSYKKDKNQKADNEG